jgi:hypothetical protein
LAADNHFSRDVLPKNNAAFGDKPMQATNFGKPGDLPVQRREVITRSSYTSRTVKALGLTVPLAISALLTRD